MHSFTFFLALAALGVSAPTPQGPGFSIDTSIPGSTNVGRANGQQFITGQCTSNADCQSGCCAGLPSKGAKFAQCSGPAVGNVDGKRGCGFTLTDGASSTSNAATPKSANGGKGINGVTVDTSIPGSQSVGKANGQQFITGQCSSNADCWIIKIWQVPFCFFLERFYYRFATIFCIRTQNNRCRKNSENDHKNRKE